MAGRKGILLILAAAGWLAFAGMAGSQSSNPMAMIHVTDFPNCCPRPAWWDEVEVGTRIRTMEEFRSVWQNRALSDEQRAKALFQAVEDFHWSDDDITAAAVN